MEYNEPSCLLHFTSASTPAPALDEEPMSDASLERTGYPMVVVPPSSPFIVSAVVFFCLDQLTNLRTVER